MTVSDFFIRLGNPFISLILRSPWHRLFSRNIMLISYQGRKSGRTFTTPVNFLRDEGLLKTVSLRSRRWWRNLRGGVPVTLWLDGKRVTAWAEVYVDTASIAASLGSYLKRAPGYARFLGIRLGDDGSPVAEDVLQAAQLRVIVHFKPAQS